MRQGGRLPRSAAAPFKDYQRQVIATRRPWPKLSQLGVRIVSGRTESHLFLVAATKKTPSRTRRRRSAGAITVNKNAIPNDPEKPFVTSCIRIVRLRLHARFREADTCRFANHIADVLEAAGDKRDRARGRGGEALCARFPVLWAAMRASYGFRLSAGG